MMNETPGRETAKLRILIEDDTSVAMMMACLLTRAKCEVAVAPTAERGVQLAETGNFDLITLDVDLPMPGPNDFLNGFEVCRWLKANARLRHTPVVFVSARPSERDVRHGLELGAADYITKPFEAFKFVPRLLSHVRQTQEVFAAS
jgi:putative two-component system response regulator